MAVRVWLLEAAGEDLGEDEIIETTMAGLGGKGGTERSRQQRIGTYLAVATRSEAHAVVHHTLLGRLGLGAHRIGMDGDGTGLLVGSEIDARFFAKNLAMGFKDRVNKFCFHKIEGLKGVMWINLQGTASEKEQNLRLMLLR